MWLVLMQHEEEEEGKCACCLETVSFPSENEAGHQRSHVTVLARTSGLLSLFVEVRGTMFPCSLNEVRKCMQPK